MWELPMSVSEIRKHLDDTFISPEKRGTIHAQGISTMEDNRNYIVHKLGSKGITLITIRSVSQSMQTVIGRPALAQALLSLLSVAEKTAAESCTGHFFVF